MTAIIKGARSYAHFFDEATYGTIPVSPDYYYVPLQSNTLLANREHRKAAVFAGVQQQITSQVVFGMVAGQISMDLIGRLPPAGPTTKSLAQVFLEWGFDDQETVDLPSKGLQWAEGPDTSNRVAKGVRCNSANLVGQASDGSILLTLDLMGQDEDSVGTAVTRPNDVKKCVGFLFKDATLEIDTAGGTSYTAAAMAGFNWSAQRGLVAVRENSIAPTDITSNGEFVETFAFTLNKRGATYDAIRRDLSGVTEISARLTMQGLHMGTGTGGTDYAKVVVVFPRLAVLSVGESGGRGLINQVITCDVLKPMTSSNGHTMTWSQV